MNDSVLLTPLQGLLVLNLPKYADSRGSFSNIFRPSNSEFVNSWSTRSIEQVNMSITNAPGTIRGMHYQISPYKEAKLIRCIRGSVWDVAIDLNPESSSYLAWHAVELNPENSLAMFIPEGFAHGFQVLKPNSELLYFHSAPWSSDHESGVRFDDPTVNITWPLKPIGLSPRDLSLPFIH